MVYDAHRLHEHILEDLLSSGATIDDFRFCPYHPEAAVDRYRKDSDWRKPGAGMILDLLRAWNVDPRRSLLIGDKDSDIRAARAAGTDGHLYSEGNVQEFVEPLVRQLVAAEPLTTIKSLSSTDFACMKHVQVARPPLYAT